MNQLAGGMIKFPTTNEETLSLQDAGLLCRSLKRSSRFCIRSNAIRRVQTYFPRFRIARVFVFGPVVLQKCDRLSGIPNDVITLIDLQFDVRIPDGDHGVLRGAGFPKTYIRKICSKRMILPNIWGIA